MRPTAPHRGVAGAAVFACSAHDRTAAVASGELKVWRCERVLTVPRWVWPLQATCYDVTCRALRVKILAGRFDVCLYNTLGEVKECVMLLFELPYSR